MISVARVLAAAACLALTGCFEVDTRISVNADGTGTVTERMLLKGVLAEMIQGLGANGGGGVLNREELEEKARLMGPGVSLRSASALPQEQGLGYEAVFAFRDVDTLRVNQSPKSPGSDGRERKDMATEAYATFRLERGPRPVLTIHPQRVAGKESAASGGTREEGSRRGSGGTEMSTQMMKKLLGGMRVSVVVEVNGTILETNATHRDGSQVTLIELDLDRVLEAPEGLETLEDLSGSDLAAMKEALKRFPGVKVELEPEVSVTFQPLVQQADRAATSSGPRAMPRDRRRAMRRT